MFTGSLTVLIGARGTVGNVVFTQRSQPFVACVNGDGGNYNPRFFPQFVALLPDKKKKNKPSSDADIVQRTPLITLVFLKNRI